MNAIALFWRWRARRILAKNRLLRWDAFSDHQHIEELDNALREAAAYLNRQEWVRFGAGPNWRSCPECRAEWHLLFGVVPPEHDATCELGKAAAAVRRAIQRKVIEDLERRMIRLEVDP